MTDATAHDDWRELYAEAFRRFRLRALWNFVQHEEPLPANALSVGRALRVEGDMQARRFAERLEAAARAAE